MSTRTAGLIGGGRAATIFLGGWKQAGAVASMRDSGLNTAEVQDLVPVKPVADETEAFVNAVTPKLQGLLAKLRP